MVEATTLTQPSGPSRPGAHSGDGDTKTDPQDSALTMVNSKRMKPSPCYVGYVYREEEENALQRLSNWIDRIYPTLSRLTVYRDMDLVVFNAAKVEDELDDYTAIDNGARGRGTAGIGGSYTFTTRGLVHEHGRSIGDILTIGALSGEVVPALGHQSRSRMGMGNSLTRVNSAKQLLTRVYPVEIDHCPYIPELYEFAQSITGRGMPDFEGKFDSDWKRYSCHHDWFYCPAYLTLLREMQGLTPYAKFAGDMYFSDQPNNGLLEAALHISGTNLQTDLFELVEVDTHPETNMLDTVRVSMFDCSPEALRELAKTGSCTAQEKLALKWAALVKAQREHADMICLKDLLTQRVNTVEKLKVLLKKFSETAKKHWEEETLRKPYLASQCKPEKSMLSQISYTQEDYGMLTSLPKIIDRNIAYYETLVTELQQEFEGVSKMDPFERNFHATKAIINNGVTVEIRHDGTDTVVTTIKGKEPDEDITYPLKSVIGIFTKATPQMCKLSTRDLERIYDLLAVKVEPPTHGPFEVQQKWIRKERYADLARESFPCISPEQATKELDDLFARFEGTIRMKPSLSYLSNDALEDIIGERDPDPNAYSTKRFLELRAQHVLSTRDRDRRRAYAVEDCRYDHAPTYKVCRQERPVKEKEQPKEDSTNYEASGDKKTSDAASASNASPRISKKQSKKGKGKKRKGK